MSGNGNTRPLGYLGPKKQEAFPKGAHPLEKILELKDRKRVPSHETKQEKFYRLGTARMGHALYAIKLVGNLARTDVYKYTPDDVARINAALIDAIRETMSQFNKTRKEIEFTF